MTHPVSDRSLPAIPNQAGEPRPPRAPRIAGPWTGRHQPTSHHHTAEEMTRRHQFLGTDTSRKPDNPILEEVSARRSGPHRVKFALHGLIFAALPFAAFVGVGLLLSSEYRQHLGLYSSVVAGLTVLFFLAGLAVGRELTLRASAHILVDGDKGEVRLYRLTKVSVVDTRRQGPALQLTGTFGTVTRSVLLPFGLLEGNQQLWDLVYNGIRHSVAKGAQTDPHTRDLLRLTPAPHQLPDKS